MNFRKTEGMEIEGMATGVAIHTVTARAEKVFTGRTREQAAPNPHKRLTRTADGKRVFTEPN